MMINTEMTTVVVHLATNRASDFGSELPLKCIDYVRVITLPVFLPCLFSDDLHTFTCKKDASSHNHSSIGQTDSLADISSHSSGKQLFK